MFEAKHKLCQHSPYIHLVSRSTLLYFATSRDLVPYPSNDSQQLRITYCTFSKAKCLRPSTYNRTSRAYAHQVDLFNFVANKTYKMFGVTGPASSARNFDLLANTYILKGVISCQLNHYKTVLIDQSNPAFAAISDYSACPCNQHSLVLQFLKVEDIVVSFFQKRHC